MIDNFKTDLVVRAAKYTPEQLLRIMGYRNPGTSTKKRLQSVLESPDFGLEQGSYDFRYTSRQFLTVLCIAVGMERPVIKTRVEQLEHRIEEERVAFKPYLWVDTDFKRQNQPVFMLAALNQQRYLHFTKGFWRNDLASQLEIAQSWVRVHMSKTDGELGTWGRIQQYLFYYTASQAYILAPSGEVIGEHEGPVPNGAAPDREMAVMTNVIRQGPTS